jgi:hypothetical protein
VTSNILPNIVNWQYAQASQITTLPVLALTPLEMSEYFGEY